MSFILTISLTHISHQSEPATVTESIVVSLGYTTKAFVIFAGSIWILARNAECILSNTDQWLVEIQRHRGQIQWPKMTRNTEPISFWKTLPTVTISNTYVLSELWHSSYFFPTNDHRYQQWHLPRGEITLKEHCIARLNWGKDKLCQIYLQPISHFTSLIPRQMFRQLNLWLIVWGWRWASSGMFSSRAAPQKPPGWRRFLSNRSLNKENLQRSLLPLEQETAVCLRKIKQSFGHVRQ